MATWRTTASSHTFSTSCRVFRATASSGDRWSATSSSPPARASPTARSRSRIHRQMDSGALGGTPDLLERERELGMLDALVDAAAGGAGCLALIEGPAGIGKSLLLGETRRLGSGSGMNVLYARGGELEAEFPYGIVRQLFEPLLGASAGRDELFEGAAGASAPVFEAQGAENRLDGGSFATLHGLYWLPLNLAARQPLLLAVDDLHWCDRPSLRFLAYLTRRLEGVPVLVA